MEARFPTNTEKLGCRNYSLAEASGQGEVIGQARTIIGRMWSAVSSRSPVHKRRRGYRRVLRHFARTFFWLVHEISAVLGSPCDRGGRPAISPQTVFAAGKSSLPGGNIVSGFGGRSLGGLGPPGLSEGVEGAWTIFRLGRVYGTIDRPLGLAHRSSADSRRITKVLLADERPNMIKRDWDLLFSKVELHNVLEAQVQTLPDKVYAILEQRFERETNDLLAASVASELVVSPIELLEDEISVSSREADVDVSHDPLRHFSMPGPHYVKGLEITYHLPYVGDAELLRCRPSRFNLNPPRAVIRPSELRFPYDQADRDVAATKSSFSSDLAALKDWVGWVNSQVLEHNTSLEGRAQGLVERRRAEIDKTKSDLAQLPYPMRGTAAAPSAVPEPVQPETRAKKRLVANRRYDVALCFAGEDREYVEQVANVLDELSVAVFYDRFEEVDLWGKDLMEHLHGVYSKESHFVVVFVSRYSADKAWPRHERRSALSRHVKGETERILPVRFDDTEIPGLPSTIAYLDARALAPKKLAELIRQKVDSQ